MYILIMFDLMRMEKALPCVSYVFGILLFSLFRIAIMCLVYVKYAVNNRYEMVCAVAFLLMAIYEYARVHAHSYDNSRVRNGNSYCTMGFGVVSA